MSQAPVHRRTVSFEAYEQPGALEVVGRLLDERPWADGHVVTQVLHQMELRVVIRLDDLVIVEASPAMEHFPHAECPAIEPAFEGLVGLAVGRGYTREVQRRFGGVSGCSHLEHLARTLGPVVVQAVASHRAKAVAEGREKEFLSAEGGAWLRNTCHVWADGGVGLAKLAAGWRPGRSPVPAPALADIRGGAGAPSKAPAGPDDVGSPILPPGSAAAPARPADP